MKQQEAADPYTVETASTSHNLLKIDVKFLFINRLISAVV